MTTYNVMTTKERRKIPWSATFYEQDAAGLRYYCERGMRNLLPEAERTHLDALLGEGEE